uniref:Leucine rich repeat containing 74A n=1 Tax=Salarias fasciatus TaxID=181472 RepID=A0A672GLX1_SALFA
MADLEEAAAGLQLLTSDQKLTQDQDWDTDLDEDGTRGLSRAEVYLQACRRIGAVPVSAFVRAVSDTTVNLNRYGVGPRGARALAVALKVTDDKVVTKLELEDNRLKAEGTRYLMKMLQSNTTIESLVTMETPTTPPYLMLSPLHIFCVFLFQPLPEHFTQPERFLNLCLEFLDLSWNRLRGASSLFAVNSTLKQLLLSHSSLGGTEAKCLSQALTENRTLELLDLSANTMDDEAAGLLSLGLTSNPTLRLVYNPMTNTGALSLLKAALSNKSALENLDISVSFTKIVVLIISQSAMKDTEHFHNILKTLNLKLWTKKEAGRSPPQTSGRP